MAQINCYTVEFRRLGDTEWETLGSVVGHRLDVIEKKRSSTTKTNTDATTGSSEQTTEVTEKETDLNTMVFYLRGGGVRTVRGWSNCEIKLGGDWKEFCDQNASASATTD